MGYFDLFDFLFNEDEVEEDEVEEYEFNDLENQKDSNCSSKERRHKMLRNAEQYFDYITRKYRIKNKTLKFHNMINIILNVLTVLGLTVFAFLNNFSISYYIIFMIIGFIVFDIFCVFFEKLVLFVMKLKNKLKYKKQLKRFMKLSLEEQLKEINKKKKERKNIVENGYNVYYNEELKEIDKEIEEYNKNIKDMKEEDKEIENAITKRYLQDISYAERVLANLDEQKEDYPSKIENRISKVVEQSMELINICKNEPILIGNLMKTFNIYLVELLDILNTYKKMSKDERDKNKEKLDLVFNELTNHLIELKEKIQSDSNDRFNNNIDLLLQSLKEDRKEEN